MALTLLEKRASEYYTAIADAQHAREVLYRQIRRERKKGKSLRDIAKMTGLTYVRIDQIVQAGKDK